MAEMRLVKTRFRAGIWEGVLSGASGQPVLDLHHKDRPVGMPQITAIADRAGDWAVSVPVPADLLSEGVETFVICDRATGDRLAHFTIISGVALEDDIRAEVDLLRAELDMLKRAFRRHCLETSG